MFIGHWAPAFAAAAISERAPKLGTLFIAGQLVDWGFFAFAAVGIEKMRIVDGTTAMNPLDLYHMPYTHSLLGSAIWALAFTGLLFFLRRDLLLAAIGGFVVLSHWFLDFLVHRPDLTLAGEQTRLGLGLWNVPPVAIGFELAITLGAFWWYRQRSRGPVMPPWILLGVLLAMQCLNWFGPEPQSADLWFYAQALAAFGIATALAYWVGTTRRHNRDRGLAVAGAWR